MSKNGKFDCTQAALLALCAGALAALLASLSWKIVQDTPVMLYQARLMAGHGLMPYRDFFCINMPGSLWFYAFLLQVCGLSDFLLHLANAILVLIPVALCALAFPPGQRLRGGLFAAALGVLRIFSGECFFILQRELLALTPLSLMAFVALRRPLRHYWNEAVLGLALGALVLVKPQFVLFGMALLPLFFMDHDQWPGRLRAAGVLATAFLLPLALCVFWLQRNDAFGGFFETLQYWKLYGQMTQEFTFLPPAQRWPLIAKLTLGMLCLPYTFAALGALALARREGTLPMREFWFWLLLPAAALLILTLGGQFWGYHKLPFFFFTLVATGHLCACRSLGRWLAILLAAVWLPFAGFKVWRETTQPSTIRLRQGVAAAFTESLARLRPGATVQPQDWTYAALHAMLNVDAPPATRFLEYSYFQHSVSTPLIQRFRREFLEALSARPPQFILEALLQKWPNGVDTANFAEFEKWRDAHYRIVETAPAYRIWEYHDRE